METFSLSDDSGALASRAPFPAVSSELRERFELQELMLGAFTLSARAMDVDFANPFPAETATRVLEACITTANGGPVPVEFLLELTIGLRIECLLQIVRLEGTAACACIVHCATRGCGARLEIELPLDDVVALRNRQEARTRVELDYPGGKLSARLPRGRDQVAWSKLGREELGRQAILTRLLTGDTEAHSPILPDGLEERLSDADPLIDFRIRAGCPDCGSAQEHSIDLQALGLEELERRQRGLWSAVHELARGYHWSEREILALPGWRRSHYRRLLAEAG